jgi:hypothetical protein
VNTRITEFEKMVHVPRDGKRLRTMSFSPHGLLMLQSWNQVGLYLRTLDKYMVTLFVEIGVADGGLREFITPRAAITEGFSYLGCELVAWPLSFMRPSDTRPNCTTYIGDCFGQEFADILRKKVAQNKRVFIFCDGGNKPKELAYFKDFLRTGDLIAAHDFTDEIQEEDLECLKSEWQELDPELYRKALVPLFQRKG